MVVFDFFSTLVLDDVISLRHHILLKTTSFAGYFRYNQLDARVLNIHLRKSALWLLFGFINNLILLFHLVSIIIMLLFLFGTLLAHKFIKTLHLVIKQSTQGGKEKCIIFIIFNQALILGKL